MTEHPSTFVEPFVAAAIYRDPKAALAWLESAFGFELSMLIEGPDGNPGGMHAEMSLGGRGRIMVGGEWADWVKSPASVGGANTCNVHVYLVDGIDAHCARARTAGADIIEEPADQFYGDRHWARIEGHVGLCQRVQQVSRAGLKLAIGPNFRPAWADHPPNERCQPPSLDRTLARRRSRAAACGGSAAERRGGPGELAAELGLAPSAAGATESCVPAAWSTKVS